MADHILDLFQSALALMGDNESARGPRPIRRTIDGIADMDDANFSNDDEETLWGSVFSDDPNNPFRLSLGRALRRWDRFESALWIDGTQSYSDERRARSYELLAVPEARLSRCNEIFEVARPPKKSIVIADQHEEWYTLEKQVLHDFYWRSFSKYLADISDWPETSIASLDEATTSIVERLSDPENPEIYATKGLVVGYVQSGKTANFTAVAAKAADAGYRLIIILAGTLNILRKQTQRRLDREIVGREVLVSTGTDEYSSDDDWPDKFVSYGELPSELGYFDWARLTDSANDYQRLKHGLPALNFTRKLPGRRFNDPANLHGAPARLIVIKKNPQVMQKLNDDLKRLQIELEEVPALVIDDESDQASVNTRPPSRAEIRERTATNREIVNLLSILPRAQYIGYTATPFANVFIDPSDAEDLFPKDYIIGLSRPDGYMGVRDFFDFADDGGELTDDEVPDGYLSNERAFVRDVRGEDTEKENLQKAIVSFILSGALKLYRKSKGVSVSTKHHTMLVHKSVKQADHESDKEQVEQIYHGLGVGRATFYASLEVILNEDYLQVSRARAPDLPEPGDFDELKPHIDECINKVNSEGKPVRVVNGDPKYADHLPDFDRKPVWAILVGGTKLSRGYTVEGLTVSYYRRKVKQADTLMQVGRWFGFRRGFRDLVRLFVGREEPDGKNGVFDLYLAFRSICQDEERFREELERYAKTENGEHILPRQVPPLVIAHMLKPTSASKMYNTKLVFQNLGGRRSEKGSTPDDASGKKINAKQFKALVSGADDIGAKEFVFRIAEETGETFMSTLAWRTSLPRLVKFLTSYQWNEKEPLMQREIEYLQGTGEHDPEIDNVLILAPQRRQRTGYPIWKANNKELTTWSRSRIAGRRFGAISGSVERQVADYFAAVKNDLDDVADDMKLLKTPRTAVMLVFPIVPRGDVLLNAPEISDRDISIGFGIRFPYNSILQQVAFGVKDSTRKTDIAVPNTGQS